jgi:heme o synthase
VAFCWGKVIRAGASPAGLGCERWGVVRNDAAVLMPTEPVEVELPVGSGVGVPESAVERTARGSEGAEGGWWAAAVELTKPRITRLVAMTAGVGFIVSAVTRGMDWATLAVGGLGCVVGTVLSSAGANALNQWMEADRDARMNRTKGRPIPSGRLSPGSALAIGVGCCLAGLGVLWAMCGPGAAAVSLVTMVTYLAVYTPLKPITILNTWVGAVPGALPPMIGWTAAAWLAAGVSERQAWAGLAEAGGWSLFVLMAVWQIPHFLAIAWMHREDYARGGYRMLPIIDPTGRRTAVNVMVWSVVLLPATLGPWWMMPERLSMVYFVAALLVGVPYLVLATGLMRDHSAGRARRVFLASIVQLPVLLAALVVDGVVGALLGGSGV